MQSSNTHYSALAIGILYSSNNSTSRVELATLHHYVHTSIVRFKKIASEMSRSSRYSFGWTTFRLVGSYT